jgi:hypothetical protein
MTPAAPTDAEAFVTAVSDWVHLDALSARRPLNLPACPPLEAWRSGDLQALTECVTSGMHGTFPIKYLLQKDACTLPVLRAAAQKFLTAWVRQALQDLCTTDLLEMLLDDAALFGLQRTDVETRIRHELENLSSFCFGAMWGRGAWTAR